MLINTHTEDSYCYCLFHSDYGVLHKTHYKEIDEEKKGFFLPKELGEWGMYFYHPCKTFSTEEEAIKFIDWLMPAAKEAVQVLKLSYNLMQSYY